MTDDDQGAEAPKRPGFLRRLFGGGAPPSPAPEAARPAPAPEPPPPEPPRAEAPQPPPAVPPSLEASPQFEAPAPVEAPPPAVAEAIPPTAPEPAVPRRIELYVAEDEPEPDFPQRKTWWSRLRQGLARSSSSIGQGITEIFTKRQLDDAMLEELDDILIRADLGVATAARITAAVAEGRYDKAVDPEEVKAILAREVEAVLEPYARPLLIDGSRKPFTILTVGVNGSGKTTTIGKLAATFSRVGFKVMLAAGDTFRAAAIEQLTVWGDRTGAPVVTREQGADAAGLAFDAYRQAQEEGHHVLLIDTAGRLQNRTELMDELAKIVRVLRKLDAEAPHAVLLVLDATVGQNAMSQVEIFGKIAGVTGLVMTKLDGTARGGILVAIAEKYRLPVHFIGVGEGVDDLQPFAARDFARAIAGLDA